MKKWSVGKGIFLVILLIAVISSVGFGSTTPRVIFVRDTDISVSYTHLTYYCWIKSCICPLLFISNCSRIYGSPVRYWVCCYVSEKNFKNRKHHAWYIAFRNIIFSVGYRDKISRELFNQMVRTITILMNFSHSYYGQDDGKEKSQVSSFQ